jgi:hypothetical protein
MKIDLSTINFETDGFMKHSSTIAGEEVWLVQPCIGAKWTVDNLHMRSSIWNSEGELISASFPKFFNWREKPDVSPVPSTLVNAKLLAKIDGSTLIVSRYKHEFIFRTRGTFNARTIDNGYEVDYLMDKYPEVRKFMIENEDSNGTVNFSLLFEWVSPTNIIVLRYGDDPDMYLTGGIYHSDYSLFTQHRLDFIAEQLLVKRPHRFSYNSVEEMLESVKELRGQEGLCVYFNNDQSILKVKSASYLYLHKMKSELSSTEKIIDVYLDQWVLNDRFLNYNEFFGYIENCFDYELASYCRGNISKICEAVGEINNIVAHMTEFVIPLKSVSRREAAEKIIQAYGKTSRSSFVFRLLDNKKLGAEEMKKLLFQCLKN